MRTNILIFSFLVIMTSCGKDSGGGSSNFLQAETVPLTDGTYHTALRPLNPKSAGYLPYGTSTIRVNGDEMSASVTLDDATNVEHEQNIHMGSRCPEASDDKNGDGFVDYEEAMAVVGPVILPLDNDIQTQKSGEGNYPTGRSVTYSRKASVDRLTTDLWQADEDESDNIMKLNSGASFGVVGRVVLVHGVSNKSLPASVKSKPNQTPGYSLPIVCGMIQQI
jgi:hypothetical protein